MEDGRKGGKRDGDEDRWDVLGKIVVCEKIVWVHCKVCAKH